MKKIHFYLFDIYLEICSKCASFRLIKLARQSVIRSSSGGGGGSIMIDLSELIELIYPDRLFFN